MNNGDVHVIPHFTLRQKKLFFFCFLERILHPQSRKIKKKVSFASKESLPGLAVQCLLPAHLFDLHTVHEYHLITLNIKYSQ